MRVALLFLLCGLTGCDRLLPYRPGHATDRGDDGADLQAVDGRRDSARPDASAPWRTIVDLGQPITACPAPWIFDSEIAGCASPLYKCGQTNASALVFPSSAPYTRIRGRLRGRQRNSTDGFGTWYTDNKAATIDNAYVEGVSVCLKNAATGARRHVWTFAVGLMRDEPNSGSCPCTSGTPPPAFVGDAWTCESGNATDGWTDVWYPLTIWGDQAWLAGCVRPAAGAPWSFDRVLAAPTTDSVEVRILYDDCDENVGITELKIEVR